MDLFKFNENPKWWQRITFFTYVSHEMILESIEKVVLLLLGKNTLGMTIDYLISPLVCFMIVIFAAKIIMKNKTIWNVIAGGR